MIPVSDLLILIGLYAVVGSLVSKFTDHLNQPGFPPVTPCTNVFRSIRSDVSITGPIQRSNVLCVKFAQKGRSGYGSMNGGITIGLYLYVVSNSSGSSA